VDADYAVMRVFFGTDRTLTASTKPGEMFGADRAEVRYGACEVSIPRDHRMGELEAPSILKLEFREDPVKHVVLLTAVTRPRDAFFVEVAARVAESDSKSAFLFVHGYNVTFEDAARRTAQMAYDLAFTGAPIFYSWPSQGAMAAYTVDEANIEWSQTNLKAFLRDVVERTGANKLYVIAHSMGNRAMTRAVASLLGEQPALRPQVTEVILAAPDIDAEVFARDIAPVLVETGRPITLYASSADLALTASKKVHGYPRAGDAGPSLFVAPGIETIDATAVDSSLVGHSYFADSRSVLSDMFHLVRDGQRATRRFGLRAVDVERGRYWEFKP
jgi:esterase/lipase superfamily enzyme